MIACIKRGYCQSRQHYFWHLCYLEQRFFLFQPALTRSLSALIRAPLAARQKQK